MPCLLHMAPGSSVQPLSPGLFRNVGSRLEDVAGPSSSNSPLPLFCQRGVSSSVSFPPTVFHFALSALAQFGVWVLHPTLLGCKQTPPPLPLLSVSTFHTCVHFVYLSIFCLSLSLSTHLSSQRILHWSNECANSACCIKCGHPSKLHPLQGIGVIVVKLFREPNHPPQELHMASPVAVNHQSQAQLSQLKFWSLMQFPPAAIRQVGP